MGRACRHRISSTAAKLVPREAQPLPLHGLPTKYIFNKRGRVSYSSWSEAEEPNAVEAAGDGDCASGWGLLLKALETELHEGECIELDLR